MLFLHNTSRVEDEPYPKLLGEKGFRGFPSLCFMDAEGTVLAKPPRSVAGFRETHTQAKRVLELRAKGDKASADEQKQLLLTELRMGLLQRDEIQPRADKLTLSADDKAYVAGKLVDFEVAEIVGKSRQEGPEKTTEALLALLAAGKTPSDDNTMFWSQMLRHASTAKDAELAQRAHAVLAKRTDVPVRTKELWQKQLDEAKAK